MRLMKIQPEKRLALFLLISMSFHADLYGRLHDAVTYRARRDRKKFTRRQRGETIIVWRLAKQFGKQLLRC